MGTTYLYAESHHRCNLFSFIRTGCRTQVQYEVTSAVNTILLQSVCNFGTEPRKTFSGRQEGTLPRRDPSGCHDKLLPAKTEDPLLSSVEVAAKADDLLFPVDQYNIGNPSIGQLLYVSLVLFRSWNTVPTRVPPYPTLPLSKRKWDNN